MDNFDLRKYLAEGRLLKEEVYVDFEDDLSEVTVYGFGQQFTGVETDDGKYYFIHYFDDVGGDDSVPFLFDYLKKIGGKMEIDEEEITIEVDYDDLRPLINENKLIKEDVSSRFIKKYLAMIEPGYFEDIEDIESYSDRDKAILTYLAIEAGVNVDDKMAKDIRGKSGEDIIKYFENYRYMPRDMKSKFGVSSPTGMEFVKGSPEKVHLDAYGHNRKINKILRDKYPDVIDFMKKSRTGGDAIEVHNAIQNRYSDEAKDGRNREVSYEEYTSDFADAMRDRM